MVRPTQECRRGNHLTEEFDRLIKQLGEAVCHRVESQMAGKEWISASLDVRYEGSGGSWLSKIRAVTTDRSYVSVKMNNDIDLVLISLETRRKLFGAEWYGLLLTVGADRRCEIKLNYDPACSQDESFFQT